jgi:hypothetical protein
MKKQPMKYPRLSQQENTLAATVYWSNSFMEKAELSLDSVTEKIVSDKKFKFMERHE